MRKFLRFSEFLEIANPAPGEQPVANPSSGVHGLSPTKGNNQNTIPSNQLMANQDLVATAGPGMTFMGFADPKMINAIIADPNNLESKNLIPTKNIKAVIRGGKRIDVTPAANTNV